MALIGDGMGAGGHRHFNRSVLNGRFNRGDMRPLMPMLCHKVANGQFLGVFWGTQELDKHGTVDHDANQGFLSD